MVAINTPISSHIHHTNKPMLFPTIQFPHTGHLIPSLRAQVFSGNLHYKGTCFSSGFTGYCQCLLTLLLGQATQTAVNAISESPPSGRSKRFYKEGGKMHMHVKGSLFSTKQLHRSFFKNFETFLFILNCALTTKSGLPYHPPEMLISLFPF